MAKFFGSVQEFHHFIGPKVRNAINNSTRKHREQKGGICEHCGKQAELQSAHVHGRERRTIIEEVLRRYLDDQGNVLGVLEEIESRILVAHLPIEDTFKFLCQRCHALYDSGSNGSDRKHSSAIKTPSNDHDRDFSKLSRIQLWADRPHQTNHHVIRAFLALERNGQVEHAHLRQYCIERLGIRNFDAHYASMKTDAGNGHGKVFFDEGSKVKMWDRARREVERFFGTPSASTSGLDQVTPRS